MASDCRLKWTIFCTKSLPCSPQYEPTALACHCSLLCQVSIFYELRLAVDVLFLAAEIENRMKGSVQLESANHTTRGVLEELAEAQEQIQYLQQHMEYTAAVPHGPEDAEQGSIAPPRKGAPGHPTVVFSHVQLPLVSAATLTDHHGLETPMSPGLTGTALQLSNLALIVSFPSKFAVSINRSAKRPETSACMIQNNTTECTIFKFAEVTICHIMVSAKLKFVACIAVLPSAAAGLSMMGAERDHVSQQQASPLVQKSLNTEGAKQVDNSQTLSRQLRVAKTNLAKKEEELAAFVQQIHSRDQKIAASEQKIKTLERMSKAQVADIGSLKKEITCSVGAEKLRKIVDMIQDANSQFCEQFGDIPEVCLFFSPECFHITECSCFPLTAKYAR